MQSDKCSSCTLSVSTKKRRTVSVERILSSILVVTRGKSFSVSYEELVATSPFMRMTDAIKNPGETTMISIIFPKLKISDVYGGESESEG
jgi:hypothetical protein